MYRYIPVRTTMEFSDFYSVVPVRTGTYQYVPLISSFPDPVQGYRIPDVKFI
jgi:hypothetical protein